MGKRVRGKVICWGGKGKMLGEKEWNKAGRARTKNGGEGNRVGSEKGQLL